jgi:hypothetical protein
MRGKRSSSSSSSTLQNNEELGPGVCQNIQPTRINLFELWQVGSGVPDDARHLTGGIDGWVV